MDCNKLQLNDDKTEFMVIYNKFCLKNVPQLKLNINGCIINPVEKVKSLGVIFDSTLSMAPFVSLIKSNAFFHLKQISSIRNSLTHQITRTLIVSLVLSRIDYCNSLLAGLPDKCISQIQSIQNYAVRVIYKKRRSDRTSPLLKELHWLPVNKRIQYKILITVFHCLNNTGPQYLSDLLKSYVPTRRLRSSQDNLMVVPKTQYCSYGNRSFSYLGPSLWNKLPKHIREKTELNEFKKAIKHVLFTEAYSC